MPRPVHPGAFAAWVEQCQHDALTTRYPFGGTPFGLVFVQQREERWRWDQEPCCELEWLTGRINNEVGPFVAPWVYVCSLAGRDAALAEAGEHADEASVVWAMPWFAEARSRQVARVFSGVAQLQGTEVLDRRLLPDSSRFARAAKRVLARHPSRREHRLR